MKVNRQWVDKIAALAKLEFDEATLQSIQTDLEKIISFVEKLNELELDKIEPLMHISDEVNVLREDEVRQEITKQEALMNAPLHDSDYFKVPKIIKK